MRPVGSCSKENRIRTIFDEDESEIRFLLDFNHYRLALSKSTIDPHFFSDSSPSRQFSVNEHS